MMATRRKLRNSAASSRRPNGGRERRLRRQGFRHVAGTDEVGRGSLFGPVVAAAVILDPSRPIRGLDDSKRLDADTRIRLAALIRERALAFALSAEDAASIDRWNVYRASVRAMRKAVEGLDPQPDFVLVDAVPLPVQIRQRALIGGDGLSFSIAAASILAKVERDAWMARWNAVFPGYGLESNKGYSTPDHLAAIRRKGPSPLHRLSFRPVRDCCLLPAELPIESKDRELPLFDGPHYSAEPV